MKLIKRAICIAAAALMVISALSGCKKGSGDTGSDSASSGPVVSVNFATAGFSIVRAADNSEMSTLGAMIFKSVKDATGEKLTNVDDTTAVNEKGEIIIGKTSRPQSQKAIELLKTKVPGRAAEYIICFIDGSIVINGMSDDAVKAAVNKFVDDYCKTCEIKSDVCDVYKAEGNFQDIKLGGEDIGKYTIVLPKYNMSYIAMIEINAMQKAILDATGYSLEIKRDDEETSGRELIIGNAKRDGVSVDIGRDEFGIKAVGENVVISGGRNYSLAHAVKVFTDKLIAGEDAAAAVSGSFDGTDTSRDYRLIWTDEFDTLDISKKWQAQSSVQKYYGNWYGLGTARSTDPKNLYVNDGCLYINPTYDTENFYGVYMSTKNSLKFTYGFVEMSARLADGDGLWHDLWTWSDDREHLEFDIAECWGPGTAYASVIHEFTYPNGSSERKDESVKESHITSLGKVLPYESWLQYRKSSESLSLHDDFHTYACEWTEEKVTFFMDGVETTSYEYKDTETAYLYEKPQYIVLSMLVGANYQKLTLDDERIQNRTRAVLNPLLDADYWTNGDNQFIIDYVQLFQKGGHVAIIS